MASASGKVTSDGDRRPEKSPGWREAGGTMCVSEPNEITQGISIDEESLASTGELCRPQGKEEEELTKGTVKKSRGALATNKELGSRGHEGTTVPNAVRAPWKKQVGGRTEQTR